MADLLIKGGMIFTYIHEGYHALKLREADLLIEDGRVARISPGISAGCETLDAGGCLVLPGFVDSGSWSVATKLLAGLLPDRRMSPVKGSALFSHVLPVISLARELLKPEDFKAIALHGLWAGISEGTTTAAELCGVEERGALEEAAEALGIRIFPIYMDNGRDDGVIHATGQDLSCAFAACGRADAREEVRRLSDKGLLSARTVLFQPVEAASFDREIISAAGASAAISAVGCAQEGRAFPGVDFLRSGINTALATGYWGSGMMAEMRAAAFSAKQAERNPSQYKATDAFYAATVAGSRALGLDGKTGRLEPGMQGDVSVVDMRRLEPLSYPFIQYLYGASPGDVRHVARGGKTVKKDFAPSSATERLLSGTRERFREAVLRVWDAARREIL